LLPSPDDVPAWLCVAIFCALLGRAMLDVQQQKNREQLRQFLNQM
jgi:hypothetical protein